MVHQMMTRAINRLPLLQRLGVVCWICGLGRIFSGAVGAELVDPPLLDGLAAGDFATREAAQGELLQWVQEQEGRKGSVKKAYGKQSDPEVRMRLKDALKTVFADIRPGYLGVQFFLEPFQTKAEEEIYVVRVARVVPESPASQGGIERGDLISEIAGWKPGEDETAEDVRAAVQRLSVGEKVIVKLYRKGKPMALRLRIFENPNSGPVEEAQREADFKAWFENLTPG